MSHRPPLIVGLFPTATSATGSTGLHRWFPRSTHPIPGPGAERRVPNAMPTPEPAWGTGSGPVGAPFATAAQRTTPVDDRGAMTVVVAVACAAILAFTLAIVQLGLAQAGRHRAGVAADLAALAGAAALTQGMSAACERAAAISALNGAAMTSCTASGLDLLVVVSAPAGFLGQHATARARAGPRPP